LGEEKETTMSHFKVKRQVLLESPYAGDVDANVEYARLALKNSIDRGEAPLASHLLYTQVLDDKDPKQRTTGIDCGKAWLIGCDAVVFYCDRGWSPGMSAMRELCVRLRKPMEERLILSAESRHSDDDDDFYL